MAVLTTLSSVPGRRLTTAAVVSLAFALFLTLYFVADSRHPSYPSFPFSSVSDAACAAIDTTLDDSTTNEKHVIPNIVHYVWVLKDPAEFRLPFKVFVSIYSATLFWNPDKIYIHTDASPGILLDAQAAGDVWTRRILALPGVIPNFIQAPNVTDKGVHIKKMEHKADFLRMAVLRDYGGVYLDTDAVPLRDIGPLRNSGFANVLGGAVALRMRHSGYLNNGVMMSVPQSTLM